MHLCAWREELARQGRALPQGSGFRGPRRLPEQGPAAAHPTLPQGLGFPHASPGEFRLGAPGRGCGGFLVLGVAEEPDGGGAGPWLGRTTGPLSLSVAGRALGRSPSASRRPLGRSLMRILLMQPSRRGLATPVSLGRATGSQLVTLRDSCVDWTGARTGPGLECQPQFCWWFMSADIRSGDGARCRRV